MTILTAIASMFARQAGADAWRPITIQRNQAPPKPRYGSVRRHQRAASKRKARRRARQLKHF